MTGTKVAKAALMAKDVIELYLDDEDGTFARIAQKYGTPRHPETRKKMNAEELIVWATGVMMSDGKRQATAAKIVTDTMEIAFDKGEDSGVRLRALQMLGQEVGVFNNRTESATNVVIDKIENIIVHTKQ